MKMKKNGKIEKFSKEMKLKMKIKKMVKLKIQLKNEKKKENIISLNEKLIKLKINENQKNNNEKIG